METTVLEVEKSPAQSTTIPDLLKSKTWLISAVISIAAVVYIYANTFAWWWEQWWKEESYYSHGILIPLIAGFIVYFNRKPISRIEVKPSLIGLVFLIPAALLQSVGHKSGILSVAGLTLPITIAGMSFLLFGNKVTYRLAFPILFLFFMCVPPTQILDKVSNIIQHLSTTLATLGIKAIGIHAQQDGINIHLPNIDVKVAAPCSGFRMLIALLAFTTFFAYMKMGPKWARLGLIAFVFPLSLVANSVRVLMIALVGNFWGQDAMMTFHDYSGYIVLVISFAILTQISKVVKCQDFKSTPA